MVIETALLGAGTGVGLGAAAWGLRQLAHRAILRGLRAPRVPHAPAPQALPLPGGRLLPTRLAGAGGRQLAAWLALPEPTAPGRVPEPAAPGRVPEPAAPDRVPAVLVMHGWGANASTMWPVVAPLLAAGIAVLLLDARCHGASDDEPFTSMPRFAEDIGAGLRWLRERPDIDAARIALLGHSVGAAAALLHASREPGPGAGPAWPPPVRAVVSLAAFAHPQEVMRRFLAEHRVPYPVLGWYVLRHVQRVIGARFDDIAPVHTIRRLRCPVLLVHGRDDRSVPVGDALRLQRAAARAELLTVAGGHDLRDALAPHAARIVGFLQRALQPAAAPATRRDLAPAG